MYIMEVVIQMIETVILIVKAILETSMMIIVVVAFGMIWMILYVSILTLLRSICSIDSFNVSVALLVSLAMFAFCIEVLYTFDVLMMFI